MTQMYKFLMMTGILAVSGIVALSQDVAPTPPAAARPWPAPRAVSPDVAPRAWSLDLSMPADWPTPAIAPIPPIPSMDLMPPTRPAALAEVDMLGELGEAQDDGDRRAQDAAQRAREDQRRAQEEDRRAQDEARRGIEHDDSNYRRGKQYLDRKSYDQAVESFNRVIENKGSRADGSLYWRAYAQNRLGKRDEALASLAELQKAYPKSRWLDDAKALEAEIRQKSGQPISPESTADEDLKLMALQALSETDPERSIPMLEKILKSNNSPKLKERALFVLAQSHGQKSREVLASVAKGGTNPDLQSKAIEYLGVYGGHDNLQILVDVYKSSNDTHVKRAILNSFMVSGSRENLLTVARSETNPELKVQAIQLLANAGGSADLAQLYANESSVEVKRTIMIGLFSSGNADKLFDLAKNEKDPGLRHFAINQLGVMGRSKTGQTLAGMYPQETDLDNKKAIINALFVQGNASAMVEIARKETDLNLKKFVVNQLAVMHSKEATDYMMEILSK